MNRTNEQGILLHHRSKAEVPFNEWATDLPDKIRKAFSTDLRRAHQLGMSASTTLIMLRRVRHIAVPSCERVPGIDLASVREECPKRVKDVLENLTKSQINFLLTKLPEIS